MELDQIAVRFVFNKGEGIYPNEHRITREEALDLRRCMTLTVCWEPNALEPPLDARILEIEILYDGLTPYSVRNEDGELQRNGFNPLNRKNPGYPAPIIRFRLNTPVDQEKFTAAVLCSHFSFRTAYTESEGVDGGIFEDHNGHSTALSREELETWVRELKENSAFCGKVFRYPDGYPDTFSPIPARDFALPMPRKVANRYRADG